MDVSELKREAAERAVDFVESGMVLGLGHGTTTRFALERISEMLRQGKLKNIKAVPCSLHVDHDARELGIPLTNLNQHPEIDLTIDGADEVDPELNLIKGGGGALVREKVVAQASRREIIVVDPRKMSDRLGSQHSLPVETIEFGWGVQAAFVESLGADVTLRRTERGDAFRSDQGNVILDCEFGPIDDCKSIDRHLKSRAGIVGHGLFLGLATDVLVGRPDGVEHLRAQ